MIGRWKQSGCNDDMECINMRWSGYFLTHPACKKIEEEKLLSPCCEAPVAWYTASVLQDMVKIICGECGAYVKFASKKEKSLIKAGVWKHP